MLSTHKSASDKLDLDRAISAPRNRKSAPWISVFYYLRWGIPIAVSFVGIAYILFEQIVIGGHSVAEPTVLRSVAVIGLVGPTLVWLTLTWAARAAMAEAQAQNELAVRNAQARRRALHLEIASDVGQRATALLDLNSLLAQVVELIQAKFGYYHADIFLTHPENTASVPGARLPVNGGIASWVAATGEPLLCNDVQHESRYRAEELAPNILSELAVPLRAGNRIVGVLDVRSDRVNAFDKEDLTVLQILGNQIGIAIENARLFQETRRRYNAMIALHETSLDMIAQLERADLLNALLRRAVELLRAGGSSLFIYDAPRGLITNIARYRTHRSEVGVVVRPGEGLIGKVIQSGEPLIVNDYENWDGKSQVFAGEPETRGIGVPLKWRDEIIGGIVVLNYAHARPFDSDDLWLLSLFADLASIAIKNMDLHSEVKQFNQRLEFNIAERTQELSRAKEEIAEKATQLQSLLAKTIHLQEEERARIARDMHDGVVQLITSARYEIQAAKVVAGADLSRNAQGKLGAARDVLEEAEKEIRRVIYDLHPPVLDVVGLVPALQEYLGRLQSLSEIDCSVVVNGKAYRLPSETEVAVFRMIEEALHNVAVHSEAKTATVSIEFKPEVFCVTIQDDGQGFDYPQWTENRDGSHLGLLGMRERVESLGGNMQVVSEVTRGTRVSFQLPVDAVRES